MAEALKLTIADFLPAASACHYARTRFTETRAAPPHTHDFLEVFRVEEGAGWHVLNGRQRRLKAGMVVFVRAEDRHAFAAQQGGRGLEITNLAFRKSAWTQLRRRYFRERGLAWDRRAAGRREHALPPHAFQFLRTAGEELAGGARNTAALDRFLLNVIHLIEPPELGAAGEATAPIPGWLRDACESARHPRSLVEGTQALVRFAARSPEHVAREFRKHLGCTPTDWVNQSRMALAAERLGGGDDKILDIIGDCGIRNPRHFYALFHARYGMTPREYRLREQRVLRPSILPQGLRLPGQ